MALTIGVLGAVGAALDGHPLELPRARERVVLTALALAHPRPVRVDVLVAALWGDGRRGSPQTVRSYISRLRHLVGPERITSSAGGYALAVPAEALDVHRAELLLDDAATALRAGDHDVARHVAEQALALWRGDPYAELDTPAADAARTRLAQRHRHGVALLAEAYLGLGLPARAADVLAPACAAASLDEPLWAAWIRALHADGRRDEALRRADEVRRTLSAELGIEPGSQVTEAHAALLRDEATGVREAAAPTVHQGYAERDGRAIAYVLLAGAGQPVLFLHGIFLPSEMLLEEPSAAAFTRRLAAGRPLVLLDPGGIGLSDPVADDQLSYPAWASDVVAVLQALAIPRADVVAMGFGLGPALHLAVDHPERVDRLVLANSPVSPQISDLRLDDAIAQVDAGEGGKGGSVRLLAPSRVGDAAFTEWLDRAARRGARPATARAFYRMMFATSLLGLAGHVGQPTLMIERRNAVGSGAEAAALVAALPRAGHVLLDGADALPFVGDVDAWLDVALGFLGAPAPARPSRLMAVAATALAGGTPIVTAHELPTQAAAAAAGRLRDAPGPCRAVVHAGVVQPGTTPDGPAVEQARTALVDAPVGVVTRTAAFDAVNDACPPARPRTPRAARRGAGARRRR